MTALTPYSAVTASENMNIVCAKLLTQYNSKWQQELLDQLSSLTINQHNITILTPYIATTALKYMNIISTKPLTQYNTNSQEEFFKELAHVTINKHSMTAITYQHKLKY